MKTVILIIALFTSGVFAQFFGNDFQNIPRREPTALTPLFLEKEVDESYKIGPGDFFEIYVEGHNFVTQVSPEGTLTIEEVGTINLLGTTLQDSKKMILSKLEQKYKRQYCYVNLIRTKGFYIPITGGINNPGVHHLFAQRRLNQLIEASGGVSPLGKLNDVHIYRDGEIIKVNLYSFYNDGDLTQNPVIEQKDKVYIPNIELDKDVVYLWIGDDNRVLEYNSDNSIIDYLKQSSSLKSSYSHGNVHIIGVDGKITNVKLEELNTYKPKAGESIEILSKQSKVYVGGAVSRPGPYPYNPSNKIIDYITSAGTNIFSADIKTVRVVRQDGTQEILNSTLDDVRPGDYIELPKANIENTKDYLLIIGSIATTAMTIITMYVVLNQ